MHSSFDYQSYKKKFDKEKSQNPLTKCLVFLDISTHKLDFFE